MLYSNIICIVWPTWGSYNWSIYCIEHKLIACRTVLLREQFPPWIWDLLRIITYVSVFSNIEVILEANDLPEGSITIDNYNEYIDNNDVKCLNLTSCVVEEFLDTVCVMMKRGYWMGGSKNRKHFFVERVWCWLSIYCDSWCHSQHAWISILVSAVVFDVVLSRYRLHVRNYWRSHHSTIWYRRFKEDQTILHDL